MRDGENHTRKEQPRKGVATLKALTAEVERGVLSGRLNGNQPSFGEKSSAI
jgi:hypothetical protein